MAHQGLAMNQETRRRQNAFMAERNHPVPPAGPELEPVNAPNWEMPPLEDTMFQNFDFSLFAPRGSTSAAPRSKTRTRSAPPADASGSDSGSGSGDDDEDGDDDEEGTPAEYEFI